jgi:hypothetical protein
VAGEIDPLRVVNDAIENGVSVGGIADQLVPFVPRPSILGLPPQLPTPCANRDLARCSKAWLLDDLVDDGKQRWRHVEAERLLRPSGLSQARTWSVPAPEDRLVFLPAECDRRMRLT